MKKIYITGVSGTGKTTIARELDKRGYYTISIDEVTGLCSWTHQKTGEKHGGEDTPLTVEFVDQHDWICDIEYLNRFLNKDIDIAFVFGMATNQKDFLHIFDKVLVLQCKPEIFIKRIEERTDNDFGKDKGIQEQIIARSKTYGDEMVSLGATSVDTDRPIDIVVDDILAKTTS